MTAAPLGNLSPADFLAEYWQKKPLLIRNAIPDFVSPLSPEDLAGLACEEDVTARLILEQGGEYPWQLLYGPFEPHDFEDLPATHWTLLVQEVDRLVPPVADLLNRFRFIPNWRIDDIMVSYAPPDGSVGAHIDHYDVFLLQGLGRRRWQIGSSPLLEEVLIPDLDVRILQEFEPSEDWVLAPGDMLYLPPRYAHLGVALDDCMTYSIGFRAPGDAEIISGFFSRMAEETDPSRRYSDPDLRPQFHPGEISPLTLAKIRKVLRDLLADDTTIDRWFGSYVTEPTRDPGSEWNGTLYAATDLAALLHGGAELRRIAISRFAYINYPNGGASLFVSGEEFVLPPDLAFAAALLSGAEPLTMETLQDHLENAEFTELLTTLVNKNDLSVYTPSDVRAPE